MQGYFDVPLHGPDLDPMRDALTKARVEMTIVDGGRAVARVGAGDADEAQSRMQALADDLDLAVTAEPAQLSESSPERVSKALNDYVGGAQAEMLAEEVRRRRSN